MNHISKIGCCLLLLPALSLAHVRAQEFDEEYAHWPEELKINGHIIINNGLSDYKNSRPFLRQVVNGKKVVCFEPVSHDSNQPVNPLLAELRVGSGDKGNLKVVASKQPSVELLKAAFSTADVVSVNLIGEQVDVVAELTPEISKFVARGGVLIAEASWAERLGELYLQSESSSGAASEKVGALQKTATGMHLLPNCLLRCLGPDQQLPADALLGVLARQPRTVGILLEPSTMLVLSGRRMYCFGKGKATFCLPSADHLEARVESIVERNSQLESEWDSLVDLTEWRRDAIDRTLAPFPPRMPQTPHVKRGTLLIVGGGGNPPGLMERFVELAGGPDKAHLVYVPCSEADDVGEQQSIVQAWKKMGVKQATFIHTKDRHQAHTDGKFLGPLKEATGIWFGGGRQWNFADSYYGTTAHKLMKDVLLRGGVVGGSSAGASIQARYLARATPIGNTRIMAPGYERGGLGFISGVAIDQHFSNRGRQKDMTLLMSRHPQLLGIGLDEGTAIEVQQSQAKVIGKGRVYFYNREIPVKADEPDYIALPAGSIYDLAKRTVIVDATEVKP